MSSTPSGLMLCAAYISARPRMTAGISVFYQRKRAEGKSHFIALGHVSLKMVYIIFAVLRDSTPYLPAI